MKNKLLKRKKLSLKKKKRNLDFMILIGKNFLNNFEPIF